MTQSGWAFAQLLTEGIYQIRLRESKSIRIIQDELGFSLGKNGGASIEHWRKGHTPSKLSDIESLARELVRRGQLDRVWLEKFLHNGGHPAGIWLCDELFPPSPRPSSETPLQPTLTYQARLSPQNQPDPIQKFKELPTSYLPDPAPLPPGSIMPYSRNVLFVGREADLLRMAMNLKIGVATAIGQVETTAATGLGGIGKTQLASEFVHRYGQFFSGGVFWLSFADPQAIPAQVAACGDVGALELRPDFGNRSLYEKIKLVQSAWQSPVPRLLVFDNCEDPALLAQWRPSTGGCRILVTSRRGDWDSIFGVRLLALGVLSRAESIGLLNQLCSHVARDILEAIAEELGDLPLALHLAGSYLNRYRRILPPDRYLQQLRSPALLHHPSMQGQGLSPTGHIHHVGRTFAISYDRLDIQDEVDALAKKLLVHAAHFAPGEPIWYILLIQTLQLSPTDSGSMLKADQAFSRLIELGLIETKQDNLLWMHRLIAKFVRDVAADQVADTQQAVEKVVFEETARVNKAGHPMPLLAWQLHLRSVVDIAHAREDEQGANLCTELGEHLWQIGDYEGARPYFEKALFVRKHLLGEKHLNTASSLSWMGYLLHSQGKYTEAQPFFEQALAIQEALIGKDHIAVAKSLNYLGQIHYAQGDMVAAKNEFKRALQISLEIFGEDHKQTAEYLNNLGMAWMMLSDLEEALQHLQRAISINEKAGELDHPDIAMNSNNLAILLRKMGRLDEAQSHYERALAIRTKVLGHEHPDTGQSLRNLGDLLCERGDLAKADGYLETALQIYQNIHEYKSHPRMALCLASFGRLNQIKGNLDTAVQYYKSALSIQQNALSENHPDKALTLRQLGILFVELGDPRQGQKFLEQAARIYEENPAIRPLDFELIPARLFKLENET